MQTEFDSENETPEAVPVQDESQEEEAKEEAKEEETKVEPRRPAFVINVYSWATPIVGVLMLVIGLLGGYFGRPYISPKAEAVNASVEPQATSSAADAAQRQEMMNFIVGQVKHFKGDPKAPVTLIEFSDFQ